MYNRYRHSLLVIVAFLCAVAGVAKHAVALTFTEFPTPTGGSQPTAITTGPDGALWFIEAGNQINQIGRITTAGVITEFPIPTITAGASGITTGPDGALWFTEHSGN